MWVYTRSFLNCQFGNKVVIIHSTIKICKRMRFITMKSSENDVGIKNIDSLEQGKGYGAEVLKLIIENALIQMWSGLIFKIL